MKSTEPIRLNDDDRVDDENGNDNFDFYPRFRHQTEQFNQDYIITL